MTPQQTDNIAAWRALGAKLLPFTDAATGDLPLGRLLRLSLFQISVGMAVVLLTGTLNRVMIVELSVPASIVSSMVAIPLVVAPLRALIGHRSDVHRSSLGWRRGPYIWFGSLIQFGGLAIMPFALLILSGYGTGLIWVGYSAGALAFLMVGAGMHTVQTAGLALATDLSPPEARPRVVAMLYIMLLLGMAISALCYGLLLTAFSEIRLIQLIQGAAFLTVILNAAALWRQEHRVQRPESAIGEISFAAAWKGFTADKRVIRLLLATGIGAGAFAMQDILLEPYGGEVLGMTVSQTTSLTTLFAIGSILGFALPARLLSRDGESHRIAATGALVGITGFSCVLLSQAFFWNVFFFVGVSLIGLGGGLFSVCTLVSAMAHVSSGSSGIALGAWGAVHATCTGAAIALGGAMRDAISVLAQNGGLGAAVMGPSIGYGAVYSLEIILLFITIAVIGPLAAHAPKPTSPKVQRLELPAFPN